MRHLQREVCVLRQRGEREEQLATSALLRRLHLRAVYCEVHREGIRHPFKDWKRRGVFADVPSLQHAPHLQADKDRLSYLQRQVHQDAGRLWTSELLRSQQTEKPSFKQGYQLPLDGRQHHYSKQPSAPQSANQRRNAGLNKIKAPTRRPFINRTSNSV